MENSTIHSIFNYCCLACICPTEKLDEYSDTRYPFSLHTDYATVYENSDIVTVKAYGLKNINNALWSLPNLNLFSLLQADILRNVQLRVLSHFMDWVKSYLYHHVRINAFDYVVSWLPLYSGLGTVKKAYGAVSQC